MTEERSIDIFNELLKKNQHNAKAISLFLKTADRRYARKMNAQIAHSQSKVQLKSPPLISKHPNIIRNTQITENSLPQLDLSKQGQTHQGNRKQRRQEIKSLLQFVRDTRQTKLKFYNLHAKRSDHLLETKTIQRAPLHMKNIVFFGEGNPRMELRQNNSMKCSMNIILPLLKTEKLNISIHSNTTENA